MKTKTLFKLFLNFGIGFIQNTELNNNDNERLKIIKGEQEIFSEIIDRKVHFIGCLMILRSI